MGTDPTITAEYRCTTHHNACACREALAVREWEALRAERDALKASLLRRADEWDQYATIVRGTEGGAISREHEFRCQVFEAHASQLRKLVGEATNE